MNDIRAMRFDVTSAKSIPDRTDRDIEQLGGMATTRYDRSIRQRSPRCLFIKKPGFMSVILACETV
jgi:hypothetical protein